LEGSGVLGKLKSVARLGREKDEEAITASDPIVVDRVVQLRRGLRRGEVREGGF